jgi:predicted ATPase
VLPEPAGGRPEGAAGRAGTLGRMLAARIGLSPVMVGRSAPLSRLAGLLDGPHPDGLAAVALVTGEPGVGKTRLVQEVIGTLPKRAVVLAGGAEPGSLGRPYEVVRNLFGGTLPTGDDVGRAALDDITGRIGDRRALVVFEDLHWADAESVAVFEALAVAALPSTLVVATCRQEELTRRLPAGEMLERLERRHFVHHVQLERLGRAEVGAFLASVHGKVPPSGLIDTLHGRTGGNPFFLEEILNVAGGVDPAELDRQPLPWSLAELVRGQLDGAPSSTSSPR